MHKELLNGDGILIYFNSISRPYLMQENEFNNKLKPYILNSCSEGTIYKIFDKNTFQNSNLNLDYKIDKSNFIYYWKPLNQCEFAIKGSNAWIKTFGDDPYFESKFPIEFQNKKPILMIIILHPQAYLHLPDRSQVLLMFLD